jgi:hypothetical protein
MLPCVGSQDCLQGIEDSLSLLNHKQGSLSLAPLSFHISPTTAALVVSFKLLAQNPLSPSLSVSSERDGEREKQFMQQTVHVVLSLRETWKQRLGWSVFEQPVVSGRKEREMSALSCNTYLFGLQATSSLSLFKKKTSQSATPGVAKSTLSAAPSLSLAGLSGSALDLKENPLMQFQCLSPSAGTSFSPSLSATSQLGFPRLLGIQPVEIDRGKSFSLTF